MSSTQTQGENKQIIAILFGQNVQNCKRGRNTNTKQQAFRVLMALWQHKVRSNTHGRIESYNHVQRNAIETSYIGECVLCLFHYISSFE